MIFVDNSILEEIAKIKYHQHLLLTIALNYEQEQYTYFHFAINHDLSEKESKAIFQLLMLFDAKYKNQLLVNFCPDNLDWVDKEFSVDYIGFEETLKRANIYYQV